MSKFKPTNEQIDIANATRNWSPFGINLAIDAGAGTGKSATLKLLIEGIPGEPVIIKPTHSVQMCAFNKRIAEELREWAKGVNRRVNAATFNSLGYSVLRNYLGHKNGWKDNKVPLDKFKVDESKYHDLCRTWAENHIPDMDERRAEAADMLLRLVNMWRVNTTIPTSNSKDLMVLSGTDDYFQPIYHKYDPRDERVVNALINRYQLFGLEHEADEALVARALPVILNQGEIKTEHDYHIDMIDQIFWPVVWGHNQVEQWQRRHIIYNSYWVLADEAQDLSAFERALIDMHVWTAEGKKKGRVLFVGDPQQAIYGFKGADVNGFKNSMLFWNVKKALPLSTSWRSPKCAVEHARKVKKNFNVPDTARDGEIDDKTTFEMMKELQPGHAVISRTRAPMVSLAFKLLADGKKVCIVGSDLGKSINAIIKRVSKLSGFEFPKLSEYLEAHKARKVASMIKRKKSPAAISDFEDLMKAVNEVIELIPADSLEDLMDKIASQFAETSQNDAILLMTGHVSKGGEWDVVWILTPDLFPLQFAGASPEQFQQEKHLEYVAVWTRFKKTLHLVAEKKKEEKQEIVPLTDADLPPLAGKMEMAPDFDQDIAFVTLPPYQKSCTALMVIEPPVTINVTAVSEHVRNLRALLEPANGDLKAAEIRFYLRQIEQLTRSLA